MRWGLEKLSPTHPRASTILHIAVQVPQTVGLVMPEAVTVLVKSLPKNWGVDLRLRCVRSHFR